MRRFAVLFCAIAWIAVSPSIAVNKYSAEANLPKSDPSDFRNLNKPFRMSKLNILWTKAQIVSLASPIIQFLYTHITINVLYYCLMYLETYRAQIEVVV